MKSIFVFSAMILLVTVSVAQQRTFDVIRYMPPKGWKQEAKKNILIYSTTNNKTKKWCQLLLITAKAGTGNMDADMESEWAELVVKPYNVTDIPAVSEMRQLDGWNVKSSSGSFVFDGMPVSILLTTFSGFNRCASIVTLSNSNEYSAKINNLLKTVHLLKPESATAETTSNNNANVTKSAYTFTTTNFDDGWTSVEKPDWVEVTKGDLKVLIHYPNKAADAYNSVLKAGDMNAWNLLVAPHYKGIRNFEYGSIQSFESVTFLCADATEAASGKNVHVVLFKLHDYQSNRRYLEFVTASKSGYEAVFGAYHRSEFDWEKTSVMQYRNKFAVAAADLTGNWSSTDFASLSYYYTSTGGYAGSTATSIADAFTFVNGTDYNSDHSGASGQVGAMKFSRQKYNGKYKASNWELQLTNRFNGRADTFDCRFEAVKGGRILILSESKEGGGFTSSYSLVRKF
jgi:hypothetical protein